MKKLTIREELAMYGVNSLTDVQLLSIITGAKENIVSEMIRDYGNIRDAIDSAGFYDLTKTQHEKFDILSNILKRGDVNHNKKIRAITNPNIAADYVGEIRNDKQENFVLILLNTKNVPIKKINLFKGSLNMSVAHPREIFKEALKYSANSIMIAHNHPSGDVTPSSEDIGLTDRIKEVGQLMGIPLLDHIIVTSNNSLSFKQEHLI